ncbi:MAG: hypothetical protein H0T92_23290 [Pyrinomonadaceae bacterium]|nr:hypothetical protein [Pyrinomonadaceae bacterium]
MKPLSPEAEDTKALQELGRASVQVIHDLKNQFNGLKLYATFLRKRIERNERPADEHETIIKLIAGIERAASDLATLVRYGRELNIQSQPRVDLARVLSMVLTENKHLVEISADSYEGRFDITALSEAFKDIATIMCPPGAETSLLKVHLQRDDGDNDDQRALAVIEWRGVEGDGVRRKFPPSGANGVRMALAARTIEAHGGAVEYIPDGLRTRLPLVLSE